MRHRSNVTCARNPVWPAALLSALLAPGIAAAAAVAGVPPPLPPRVVTDTHFGTPIADPYRFLEEVNDPQVQAWMRAQADATTRLLDSIPGRAKLLARMQAIEAAAAGLTDNIVRTDTNRFFYLRRNPGEGQFKLVWRDGVDGTDTVIVDPEALSKAAGRPHAIMDFAPSRDGRYLAYAIQVGGGEIGTLHVIEVATGKPLVEPIDRIRYASTAWLDDGRGFFYSRLVEGYEKLPAAERFRDRTRHFYSLADHSDRPILSPSRNPDLKLPDYATAYVYQIPGTDTAAAIVSLGVERHRLLLLADLASAMRGDAKWRKVVDTVDQVSNFAYSNGWLYLRTSKGAPRHQVLRMPLAAPEIARAETVIGPSASVVAAMAGARDGLYVTQRSGATLTLARVAPAPAGARPRIEPIALPFAGSVAIDSTSARLDGVVVELGGWAHATKPWLFDGKTLAQLPFVKPGAFDAPADIESREVMVKSHDGVEVPMSIVMRKGTKLDGRNPTIVYGYGAYGTTENPFFNPRILAWLERGGIYAFVHVRGGGIFGDEWHQAGRKATKPNTWRDAIAATEWLIAQRFTAPDRVGIYGGSAGGILVGRAITERPDLFAAAVPSVGTMDTLRFETSANGAANIPEFGTVKKEDEFRALLAMSSYHHVRDGTKYPAVMLVHGVNDIRVDVWQSSKFASRLATASTSGKPVLMRLDYEAGHGQGSTRAQLQERTADVYTFMLWQFGVPEFQPAPKY
jgi:prolyl oligopeptidase